MDGLFLTAFAFLAEQTETSFTAKLREADGGDAAIEVFVDYVPGPDRVNQAGVPTVRELYAYADNDDHALAIVRDGREADRLVALLLCTSPNLPPEHSTRCWRGCGSTSPGKTIPWARSWFSAPSTVSWLPSTSRRHLPMNTMQAIHLTGPTTTDQLHPVTVAVPEPESGWVRIAVKAFGVNESEVTSRKGESSPDFTFPRILGIECLGVIDAVADGSSLEPGQQVATMMGGMGRGFDGSHAQYVVVPENQVIPFTSDLPWDVLGALPEMLQTAHGSLRTLGLQASHTVLVHGATSTVGLTATAVAHHLGATVLATSRRPESRELLRAQGADHVPLDDESLADQVRALFPDGIDAVPRPARLRGTPMPENTTHPVRSRLGVPFATAERFRAPQLVASTPSCRMMGWAPRHYRPVTPAGWGPPTVSARTASTSTSGRPRTSRCPWSSMCSGVADCSAPTPRPRRIRRVWPPPAAPSASPSTTASAPSAGYHCLSMGAPRGSQQLGPAGHHRGAAMDPREHHPLRG